MRFNVRSALSAVGSLAEGTLAGQIEAQQEQERRDAQDYQRQLQLYEIGAGQQSDLLHARLGQEPNIAEGERLGFGSSVIDAQQNNPYANAPDWLSQHVQPSTAQRFGLHHMPPSPNGQSQPVGGSNVTGFPASGGENGGSPGLTPGATTTQSSGMAQQPWATPANTPPPALAPQAQPQAPPAMGPQTPPLGQMLGGSQFGAQATQMLRTVAPLMPFNMGSLLTQATNPPAQTQSADQAPLVANGPSGNATGAAGPTPAPQQQPVDLKGVVQPAQPMPQPVEQQGVTFTGVAGTYHGVGANVQALRVAYNDLTALNKESEKIDWVKFKEDDPVGYAKAVGLFQHESSYESAKTPEGYQALTQNNNEMRSLLLTAPRKVTTAGEASILRAKIGDVTARRAALKNAFEKEISPTAPESVLRQTIANYGLTDDYKNIDDLRGRVFGKRIDEEITKIQHELGNVSHMSPGELQDLVGRLNGLKGYRPGSFKVPYSEYRKLSVQDRAALVARTQVSVDTHLAREDRHNLAPLLMERAQAGIDLTHAHIKDLEQRAQRKLGQQAGLSAVADLRMYRDRENTAHSEVQQYVKNPNHSGVEEDTMDFIDSHFGSWLHGNNPTLPNTSWEKDLKSGKDQTLAASPNKYIGYIRGVLKLHSLEVMRSAKQDELTRKFGGVPDEASAASTPAAAPSGGSTIDLSWLRPDWNTSLVQKSMSWYLSNGKSEAAARQHIQEHPELFGPGTR